MIQFFGGNGDEINETRFNLHNHYYVALHCIDKCVDLLATETLLKCFIIYIIYNSGYAECVYTSSFLVQGLCSVAKNAGKAHILFNAPFTARKCSDRNLSTLFAAYTNHIYKAAFAIEAEKRNLQ